MTTKNFNSVALAPLFSVLIAVAIGLAPVAALVALSERVTVQQ